jgi:hypothetical protein
MKMRSEALIISFISPAQMLQKKDGRKKEKKKL